jgi:hypothetical protein
MPFIIEVQDRETGKTKYVTSGEWSDYSLDDRVSKARHFKTREEVNAALQSPDFVRWQEYCDGSKTPPSIPWRGLGICDAKPSGRGRYTVYEVIYRDVMTVDVEYSLVPGTKE